MDMTIGVLILDLGAYKLMHDTCIKVSVLFVMPHLQPGIVFLKLLFLI